MVNPAGTNGFKYSTFYIYLFYAYLIVIYPFLYQYYEGDQKVAVLNRVFVAILIVLILSKYLPRLISKPFYNIDLLFMIQFSYLMISISLYSMSAQIYPMDILKEYLYSIIPILFYFVSKTYSIREFKTFIMILFFSILIISLLGILEASDYTFSDRMANALAKKGKGNFISYYSAIGMGYIAQLAFALLLFDIVRIKKIKYPLMGLFFIISLLTLQRSSYLGIIFALISYSIFKGRNNKVSFLLFGLFLLMVLNTLISTDHTNYYGFDVGRYIMDEINSFDLESVQRQRAGQSIVSNSNDWFSILFGEGFGKYSPNNILTIRKMPDASYQRIFNEIGAIGSILFFLPFVSLSIKYIKEHNSFMIYFIISTTYIITNIHCFHTSNISLAPHLFSCLMELP